MLLTAVASLAVAMGSPLLAPQPAQVQTQMITLPSIGLDGEVDLDAERDRTIRGFGPQPVADGSPRGKKVDDRLRPWTAFEGRRPCSDCP